MKHKEIKCRSTVMNSGHTMSKTKRFLSIALCLWIVSILAPVHACAGDLELMHKCMLNGEKSFCLYVEAPDTNTWIGLCAFFESAVDGFFEIDGVRVETWKNHVAPYHNFRVTKRNYRVTIGVASPVQVDLLEVTPPRDKQGYEITIPMKEVDCDKEGDLEQVKIEIRQFSPEKKKLLLRVVGTRSW